MSDDRKLDGSIQRALGEWFRLRAESKPIRDRLHDSSNTDHSVSDEEAKLLLAPDEKFSELYELLRVKYPELPPED